MVIALSISAEAGLAAAIAGGLLLALLHVLIRISRRAGLHQTHLLKSLLSVISGQLSAAKPLKAMAREDHVDALLSDQTRQLKRALRRQVVSKEALMALQEPLLAILVGVGFFLSLVYLEMPLAAVLVMLFLQARVVSLPVEVPARVPAGRGARKRLLVDRRSDRGGARPARTAPAATAPCELSQEIRFEDVSFGHGAGARIIDRAVVLPAREPGDGHHRPFGRRQDHAARPAGRSAATG